jgi:hypothetical protein
MYYGMLSFTRAYLLIHSTLTVILIAEHLLALHVTIDTSSLI